MRYTKKVLAVLVAMLIVMFSCVSAFAAISPSGKPSLNVTIIPTTGGTGSYDITTEIEEGPNGGTIVEFVPKPNPGYTFVEWELEGDYTIVEGSLTSGEFTVEAFSDLVATPYYVSDNGTPGGSVDTNTGQTSPQTGDNTNVIFVVAIVLVAMAGAVVVTRKIKG